MGYKMVVKKSFECVYIYNACIAWKGTGEAIQVIAISELNGIDGYAYVYICMRMYIYIYTHTQHKQVDNLLPKTDYPSKHIM